MAIRPRSLPSAFHSRLLPAAREPVSLASLGPVQRLQRPRWVEAGTGRRLKPCGRAWRGEVRSVPVPPALRSVPISRGPAAGRKMAARSAVDSHVSRRYRPAPPPPLVESLSPWEAHGSRLTSPPLECRAVRPGREGAATDGQLCRPTRPNPGAGSGSGNRGKPSVKQPAPGRAAGHAQCFRSAGTALRVFPATRRGLCEVGLGPRGRGGPDEA